MKDLIDMKDGLTMTSNEIAKLTGKRHDHVVRDIEVIIKEISENPDLGFQAIKGLYTVKGNIKPYTNYTLDKDATMLLVSGYSIIMRAKIIKRLSELENQTDETALSAYTAYIKARSAGKVVRIKSCKVMGILVGKMQSNGNPLPDPALYAILTDTANKILFNQIGKSDNWRNCMSTAQLSVVENADNLIIKLIEDTIYIDDSDEILELYVQRLVMYATCMGRTDLTDTLYLERKECKRMKRLIKNETIRLISTQTTLEGL